MSTIEGWVASGWEDVRRAFERNFEKDAEVGAAFAAYHRGRKVVDLWGGVADATTGRPWTEDTLVLVYSTTKGATAMCANRLADDGVLDVDAPVREYWPEFAQGGKAQVTVSDLLAHRAGLAWTDGKMSVEDMLAWEPVIRALETQAPAWPPRTAHGYHATTYGWLVGEVVRRVSGRTPGGFLRDEIAGPLGADFFIGLPESEEPRVARLVPFSIGGLLEPGGPLAGTSAAGGHPEDRSDARTSQSTPSPRGTPSSQATPSGEGSARATSGEPTAAAASSTDVRDAALAELASYLGRDAPLLKALTAPGGALRDETLWDNPRLRAAELPAANGICDARSLARLYSACVSDSTDAADGPFRVFSAKQLERALQQETAGPDSVLFGLDVQWGLGFMLNRGIVAAGGMGGPRSFGHYGMGGSVGWADPDAELAMGYVMNKMSLGTTGDSRSFRLVRACVEAARRA